MRQCGRLLPRRARWHGRAAACARADGLPGSAPCVPCPPRVPVGGPLLVGRRQRSRLRWSEAARCGPGDGQLTGCGWRERIEHCGWRRRHTSWLNWRRGLGHLAVQLSDCVDWVGAARRFAGKRQRRWRIGSVGGVGSVRGDVEACCFALMVCHAQVLEVRDDCRTDVRAERAEKPLPLAWAQPPEKGGGHMRWDVCSVARAASRSVGCANASGACHQRRSAQTSLSGGSTRHGAGTRQNNLGT